MIKKIAKKIMLYRIKLKINECRATGERVLAMKENVSMLRAMGVDENDLCLKHAQRVLLATTMADKAYRLADQSKQVLKIQKIEPYPEKWKLANLDYEDVCSWGEEED